MLAGQFFSQSRGDFIGFGQPYLGRHELFGIALLGRLAKYGTQAHGQAARRGKIGDCAAVGEQALLIQYLSYARSEEHTSELQSLMRISYAVFCLKQKK